jgi:hypothetical protein
MSEAPERIWIGREGAELDCCWEAGDYHGGGVEYVRADVATAALRAAEVENERLREAARLLVGVINGSEWTPEVEAEYDHIMLEAAPSPTTPTDTAGAAPAGDGGGETGVEVSGLDEKERGQ